MLVAGTATALFFAYSAWSAIVLLTQTKDTAAAQLRRQTIAWLAYCVPIHAHGILPMLRNHELAQLGRTGVVPDGVWLGAYPSYCKVDPRFCDNNEVIRILQGITAIVVTPLVLIALVGVIRKTSWRYIALIVPSALQMYGTLMFFAQLFVAAELPIIVDWSSFDFVFTFLFMNLMWAWVPALILASATRCAVVSQASKRGRHKPLAHQE